MLLRRACNLLLMLVRSKGIDLVAGLPGSLHILLVTLFLLVLVVASEIADSRTLIWLDPAWVLGFAAAVARTGHIVAASLLEQIVAVLEGGRVEALMMVMVVECCLPPAPMLMGSSTAV